MQEHSQQTDDDAGERKIKGDADRIVNLAEMADGNRGAADQKSGSEHVQAAAFQHAGTRAYHQQHTGETDQYCRPTANADGLTQQQHR